mgnify:CR=1 FL=1
MEIAEEIVKNNTSIVTAKCEQSQVLDILNLIFRKLQS